MITVEETIAGSAQFHYKTEIDFAASRVVETDAGFLLLADEHYKACIEACIHCMALCYGCVAEELKEERDDMRQCIQLSLECAVMCTTAAQLMSLGSPNAGSLCKQCSEACKKCGRECEKYVYKHCMQCAEACHDCAQLCDSI